MSKVELMKSSMTLCAHNSGLISLMANSIFGGCHDEIVTDLSLTRIAIASFEDMMKQINGEPIEKMREAVRQVSFYTDVVFQNCPRELEPPQARLWDALPIDLALVPDLQYFEDNNATPEPEPSWAPFFSLM